MVGTTLIQVHRAAATMGQNFPEENREGMTSEPPCASGASIVTANALMW